MEQDITWLAVIGIGENGVDGLCEEARAIVSSASVVVGGKRHLELAGDLIQCETKIWQNPIEKTIAEIVAMRPESSLSPRERAGGEGLTTNSDQNVSASTLQRPHPNPLPKGEGIFNKVCVLASGDPFCYGIGATLARHIPIAEMLVIPAPSAFSLAASKLGWALQDVITIGLNGRALEKIIPHLQPSAKILALSTDESTPALLAELLVKKGFGDAKIIVLEHLGGKKENIIYFTSAHQLISSSANFARLNTLAIEISHNLACKALPIVSGLPDELFEHDGQLTKREIRALTLSALAPRRGELLWDIGLGAGSIAIEWLLANPDNLAIGFEKNQMRARRAAQNAQNLGVPHLQIIDGSAPESLEGQDAPDAIFIGGGASNPRVLEIAWNALKTGGRLVVNAVTLETEAVLISAYQQYGGNIIRIGIDSVAPIGSFTGLKPAMRVLQWSVIK
jgi:precorrin-6Y C5,15-methyltransferase (decarboxylating)